MSRKEKIPRGDDHDWAVAELKKLVKHVNEETKDPVNVIFVLAGALVAGLAQTQGLDPYRVGAAVAENAESVIAAGGEVPPTKERMH